MNLKDLDVELIRATANYSDTVKSDVLRGIHCIVVVGRIVVGVRKSTGS
jgi:hypothetical protein